MLETTATVYLVHQEKVINSLIKQLLGSVNIFVVDFISPDDFLSHQTFVSPSCFLFDFFLPDMNGLQLMSKIRKSGVHKPCIFMSSREDIKLIVSAMHQGAFGFVKRPLVHIDFVDLIQRALEKDRKTQVLVNSAFNYQKNEALLSSRERQVLDLIIDGCSATVIGKTLNISHRTVENHRKKMFDKLNISKTTELIRQIAINDTLKACEMIK